MSLKDLNELKRCMNKEPELYFTSDIEDVVNALNMYGENVEKCAACNKIIKKGYHLEDNSITCSKKCASKHLDVSKNEFNKILEENEKVYFEDLSELE